jgi:hypothetical protein
MVRAVQAAIESGVSVYDARFAEQRNRFGEAFVHEYLSEVATHMAYHIVRAFEEHDRKRYQQCARSFGTVYTFLFPVHPREAYTAGSSYALALKQHDVIEDGVTAVTLQEPIIADYIDEDARIPPKAREILDHQYWNSVLLCFEMVAEALGLPHAYAEEQTEFFRYHTAAHEARDRTQAVSRHLGPMAMEHARRAQKIKFSVFFDDEAVLDTVVEEYLAAVRSHDAHTREEQEANIGRMTVIYDRALATVIGMAPLEHRVSAESIGRTR